MGLTEKRRKEITLTDLPGALTDTVMQEPCWWCKGTGQVPDYQFEPPQPYDLCPRCDGTGRLPMLRQPLLPGEDRIR